MITSRFWRIGAMLVSLAFLFISCDRKDDPNGEKDKPRTSYTNPVTTDVLPDPTVIRGDDGSFYLISSDERVKGLPIMKSSNLVDWTQVGQVFSIGKLPSLDGRSDGGLWAPDIAKVGNQYILYYAYYSTLGEMFWGIGAATSGSITGTWVNKGKLFTGGEIGVRCSIDPCFYSENGKNYLFWGSYYGIWAIELSADGLSVKEGAEKVRVAGADGYGLEAAMIHKRNGKYYLFVSEGGTGYKENYKVGAARADNLLGPYVNKAGKSVVGSAVDFFLSAGNGFVSPGHSSQVITDKKGQDWILYHAYVQGEEANSRRLMLSKLDWTSDGWPTVEGGIPARECNTLPSF